MAADPFPRDAFVATIKRLPADARLAWGLARDPQLSRGRRLVLATAAAYVASPIDLVPGVIPVAGQLDDLAIALLAIRHALDSLGPEQRRRHLEAAGLTEEDLSTDLATVRATGMWIGRTAARTGARLAKRGTTTAARLVVRGFRAAARRATRTDRTR